jgi:hypothetical protein
MKSKMEVGIVLKNANPYGICSRILCNFLDEYSWRFDGLEFWPKFVRQVN